MSLAVASTLIITGAFAEDVEWSTAYPSYLFPGSINYDQITETGIAFTIDGNTSTANHYAAGTTLNITGPIPVITPGSNGTATSILVRDALSDSTGANAGRITVIYATDSNGNTTPITSANIDQFSYSTNPSTPQEDQELNVVIPGLEGSHSVIKVYDSTTFASPGTSLVGDLSINVYDPSSFRIYNNFGIVSVASGGGTANINIGADTDSATAIAASENTIELLAKNSTLAKAEGTGSAQSNVNWISDNYIHFAPAAVIPNESQSQQSVSTHYNDSITLPNYIKVGNLVIRNPLEPSKTFTITSAKDIADVNDFLLGQGAYSGRTGQVQLWLTGKVTFGGPVIDSAVLAQGVYDSIIESLLAKEEQNRVNLTYYIWDDKGVHTNNATLGTGDLNVIYATGANATGTVTSQGSLAVDGASAVMRGDTGATLTNDGNINIWRSSGSSPIGIGMQLTDSTATNNGTINAGLFLEKDGSNQNVSNNGSIGIQAKGASTVNNNGYINVALTNGNSTNAIGIQAEGTTTASNSGTIAVVGNSNNADGRATGYGVSVFDAATFTNETSGQIFVGTTPITSSTGYSPTNMVGGTKQSAGVMATGSGQVFNNGTITLGESTRNAVGMLVDGATGQVVNNGTINVLGKLVNGAAAPNYGLSVNDTTNVINNGFINVAGDNNTAINVLAQKANATVESTNTGKIVVGDAGDTGGSDNDPYTYRNHAVFAEGLSGYLATANVNSAIELLSAGAIGVHARGNATINVGSDATLTFNNKNQIGYYAYGQQAKINLSNAVLNDNAQEGSILFLVDHGATFDGNSGTSAGAYDLTVNGTGSIGVFAHGFANGSDGEAETGDDILSTINTGNATITVAGDQAIGVMVAGGAQGTINDGGIILAHDNTTGVVVDGRSYTLDGQVGSASAAIATKVVSNASTTTTSSQSGIKAYDVSHKGEVTLNGNGINLNGNNNIGLYLHDGGIGINNAPLNVSGTDNIGVYIKDQGTLTNTGDITVSGAVGSGNVGVKVQGAGAVVTQLGNVTANGGLAAVQLIDNGASLTIDGADNHIIASGGADGIRMDASASSLKASNTVIDITDSGAGINNNADTSNIDLNSVTINADDGPAIRTAVTFAAEGIGNTLNVSGSGSGFAFMQADGSDTTGNLTIGRGYTINITGDDGVGILAKTDGNVVSGANITMSSGSGAAIVAQNANTVTNSGSIETSSDVHSTILADNASNFTNNGSIISSSTANSEALIKINGSAADRTILNTGTIITNSQNSTVIDATGSANNTVSNQGILQAATDTATAIDTGSGNDVITLSGRLTRGVINTGSGTDAFIWDLGIFEGEVNFTGADGNDTAQIGDVDMSQTRHILTEGGSNSTLTLTNTYLWNGSTSGSALIGSLANDDLSVATNIGTGWSQLNITGSSADVRVVNNLELSGVQKISVADGATLRTGDNTVNANVATINDYDIETSGAASQVIFDGTSADQTYSGVISGSGGVERATGGTTTLLADNTWTGDTLIDTGGTLQLGNGGSTGGLSEVTNIIDNGLFIVNRNNTVQLNGAITGSGAFHQIGTGLTRLNGNNAYQGETLVNQGTLIVNGNQSSATGATSVASGATLGGKGTIGGDVTFAGNTTITPGDAGAGTLNINGNLTLSSTTNSKFELGKPYVPGGTLNDLVNVGKDLVLDGELNVTESAGGLFLPGVYRLYNYEGTLTDNGLEIGSLPPNNSSIYSIQTILSGQVNLVLGFPDNQHTLQYWDGPDVDGSHGPTGIEGDDIIEGGDGIWHATDIDGDTNDWTTENGVGNAPWTQSDFAVFAGEKGDVTISDINGVVQNSGMQFLTDGYVLNGENSSSYADGTVPLWIEKTTDIVPTINYQSQGETAADGYYAIRVGAGGAGADITATINADLVENTSNGDSLKLLKYDPGRLVLRGNNTYTGGTEIYDGTLNVAEDSNLGLAGTSILINNNATLQIGEDFTTDRAIFLSKNGGGQFDLYGNAFTPSGLIGGDGQLTVMDSSTDGADSTLELNRENTYQGTTTVTGKDGNGDVVVNANTTGVFGLASSDITINHQGTINFNNDANAETHKFSLDDGILNFNNTASAADSVTDALNSSIINFTDTANGANGIFTLATNTTMNFKDQTNAGNAQIDNTGLVTFADDAQAENGVISNNAGGVVNIAGANDTTTIGSLSGAGNVELGAATLREGTLNRDDTISGIISGNGGSLEKVGTGTLTLTGDNTWTGTTSVEEGVLLVNGNQQAATGDVSVTANTTLGGAGTMGGKVTVADDAHIAAGADLNSVGTFTVGGLELSQNSQVDFQFGQPYAIGGSLNDLINVNGDLVLDGKLNITQTPGGSFDVGVYRVFNYTGDLTNNVMEFGNVPGAADDLYIQTSIANQVNLVNRAGLELRFWDGAGGSAGVLKNNDVIDGGDGVWQNSAGNDNWTTDETNPEGSINAPFSNNSFAVFGGEKGNVTVDNSLGEIDISGMQFTTDGYVINDGTITANAANTIIRVGDGTTQGADYTATVNSIIDGAGTVVKTDAGTLILNGDNLYTGGTQVLGGVLQVSKDNNFGQADTGITLNGGTLRYGDAFDTSRTVSVVDNGGAIDTNGNDVSLLSSVVGDGQLVKTGEGTLTLTKNSQYTGGTTIAEGNLQLGTGGTTGSIIGDVANYGVLQVNRSNTLELNGNISGTGQLWQQGNGTTVLSGNNNYSGITLVENGTLLAKGANKLSAASAHVVSEGALLDTGGDDQVVAGLVNQGTINLRGGDIGSALTVKGNYVGLDGVIKLAAQQYSTGIADKLVIDGGTASGNTLLKVDASRLGASTKGDGIVVVEALNGATTTAQTTKDAFTLGASYIQAGAYQYSLHAADASGLGENWYLRASFRPEVSIFNSLGSTVLQGDLAVLGNLHLRVGDELTSSDDTYVSKDEDNNRRFWIRYIHQSNRQRLADSFGTEANSNMNGMQVGFDLYSNHNWNAGLYTTIMDTDSSISTKSSGSLGDNSTLSTYVGGYATWTDDNGLYVDNVLQYGHHSIDLKAKQGGDKYHPNANSYVASVEIGKPFYFGDTSWAVEPQAQLVYQHSDFKDVDLKGYATTRVKVDTDDVVMGRLGLRLTKDMNTDYGKIKPYARVNLWQPLSNGKDTVSFNNLASTDGKTVMKTEQRYSTTELALGATWGITNNVQVYTEMGRSFQNSGHKTKIENDFNGSVGLKIRF